MSERVMSGKLAILPSEVEPLTQGFWPTVALPPDLAAFVGHDSATSRASINVPAPILRQGLWHRPEGASYADWLCAGVHPGSELRAPV